MASGSESSPLICYSLLMLRRLTWFALVGAAVSCNGSGVLSDPGDSVVVVYRFANPNFASVDYTPFEEEFKVRLGDYEWIAGSKCWHAYTDKNRNGKFEGDEYVGSVRETQMPDAMMVCGYLRSKLPVRRP